MICGKFDYDTRALEHVQDEIKQIEICKPLHDWLAKYFGDKLGVQESKITVSKSGCSPQWFDVTIDVLSIYSGTFNKIAKLVGDWISFSGSYDEKNKRSKNGVHFPIHELTVKKLLETNPSEY